jgi:hypothetical protein
MSPVPMLLLFGFGCMFGHGVVVSLILVVLLVLMFSAENGGSATCVKKFF